VTASYRRIDYRIRPAKHVERLMMCEAFRRLRFGSIEDYQYVGLGSVYFSDFSLYHRALGLKTMFSIEQEVQDQARFLFNRPYLNVEMMWGTTSSELPKIDLSSRSIIWLDFDGTLSRSMIEDLRGIATRCCSGTVVAMSVQANPSRFDPANPSANATELAERLNPDRIPTNLTDEQLLGWGTARVFREVLSNELEVVLSERNGSLRAGQKLLARQIFNFHYEDGAKMLTVGWVIFDEGQRSIFEGCSFDTLAFTRTGDDAFRIDIPKITSPEVRTLMQQIPLADDGALVLGCIPESDAKHFLNIYRYFPNITFADF
jgi:hypothetical protein